VGYASYIEDIQKRFESDLHLLREETKELLDTAGSDNLHKAAVLFSACERILGEIKRLAKMTREPRFDMAYEITRLYEEQKRLELDVRVLRANREKALKHNSGLEGENKALRLEVKRLKQENTELRRTNDALLTANPSAAYEMYSSSGHFKDSKPDP
jgi:hypothetical protein